MTKICISRMPLRWAISRKVTSGERPGLEWLGAGGNSGGDGSVNGRGPARRGWGDGWAGGGVGANRVEAPGGWTRNRVRPNRAFPAPKENGLYGPPPPAALPT